jgi:hypothetical protein
MIIRTGNWRDRFDRDDIAVMAFIVLVFLPPLIMDLIARDLVR